MINSENEPNKANVSRKQKFLVGYIGITIFWLLAGVMLHDCVHKSIAFMIATPVAFALSIVSLRLQELHINNYCGWSNGSFTSLVGLIGVLFVASAVTASNILRTEIIKHKPDTVVHTPNTVVLFCGDDSRSSGNVSLYNSTSPVICQKREWNWFNVQQRDKWYICEGVTK